MWRLPAVTFLLVVAMAALAVPVLRRWRDADEQLDVRAEFDAVGKRS